MKIYTCHFMWWGTRLAWPVKKIECCAAEEPIHIYIHTLPKTNSSHLLAFPRRNVVFQASTHLVEAWVRGAVAPKEPLKDVDGGDKKHGRILGGVEKTRLFLP